MKRGVDEMSECAPPRSTMFTITVDPRAPSRLYCGAYGGEVL